MEKNANQALIWLCRTKFTDGGGLVLISGGVVVDAFVLGGESSYSSPLCLHLLAMKSAIQHRITFD